MSKATFCLFGILLEQYMIEYKIVTLFNNDLLIISRAYFWLIFHLKKDLVAHKLFSVETLHYKILQLHMFHFFAFYWFFLVSLIILLTLKTAVVLHVCVKVLGQSFRFLFYSNRKCPEICQQQQRPQAEIYFHSMNIYLQAPTKYLRKTLVFI